MSDINKVKSKLQPFFGITLLVALGWGAIKFISFLFALITSLDNQIAASIIATSGTLTAGVVAVVLNQRSINRRNIQEAHRQKKTEIYGSLISKLAEVQQQVKNEVKTPESQLQIWFWRFHSELIIWGSANVIKSYEKFRHCGTGNPRSFLLVADDLMRAIRKDLGLSNSGLSQGSLIGLWLSNPEELKAVAPNQKSRNIKSEG